jgi:hypothetical protein
MEDRDRTVCAFKGRIPMELRATDLITWLCLTLFFELRLGSRTRGEHVKGKSLTKSPHMRDDKLPRT